MDLVDGENRDQMSLLPACIDDYVAVDALVRVVNAFVESLHLVELGFSCAVAAATGRPGYQLGDMLRLYIRGISIRCMHRGIWRGLAFAIWRHCGYCAAWLPTTAP